VYKVKMEQKQKEFKEECSNNNIKEVEMATTKGCKSKGKAPPKKKGGKCGKKLPKAKKKVDRGFWERLAQY